MEPEGSLLHLKQRATHTTLSKPNNQNHTFTTHFFSDSLNIGFPSMTMSSKWHVPYKFSDEILYAFIFPLLRITTHSLGTEAGCCECGDEPSGSCATELVSYMYYIQHLFLPPTKITFGEAQPTTQITKLLIIQLSQSSCYLRSVSSNYSRDHPNLKSPHQCSSLNVRGQASLP
jgi:hypothetical protein